MEEALNSLAEEKDRSFQATRPPLARPVEYVIMAIGVLLCILLYLLYGQVSQLVDGQNDIKQTQVAGKERTLVNRAIQCDLIKAIGALEPKECSSPELTPYRDPKITTGSTAAARKSEELSRVICSVLRQDPRFIVSDDICPR